MSQRKEGPSLALAWVPGLSSFPSESTLISSSIISRLWDNGGLETGWHIQTPGHLWQPFLNALRPISWIPVPTARPVRGMLTSTMANSQQPDKEID
ncbi:hypothetical protein CapIbe_011738 [Capra ibex]